MNCSTVCHCSTMKIFFILSILLKIGDMSKSEFLKLLEDTTQIRDGDVEENDVKFFLSKRNSTQNEGLFLNESNENNLDPSKKVTFLIHGWLENYSVEWYDRLKNMILQIEDCNIIEVDWERVARSAYVSSARNTRLVGIFIAEFISKQKILPENVHLIGHSLGSHVASFTAKTLKQLKGSKIKRITGLDPAGPYFNLPILHENEKLNSDDAEIVDVIHTDGGVFGYDEPLGTLDIYVNEGRRPQPGCLDFTPKLDIQQFLRSCMYFSNSNINEVFSTEFSAFCSHSRSHDYFIKSLSTAIKCWKCSSYEALRKYECSSSEFYEIFNQEVAYSMMGVCTVEMKELPPYFS